MEVYSGKGGDGNLTLLTSRPSTKNSFSLVHWFLIIILIGCLFLFLAVNILPLLTSERLALPQWNALSNPFKEFGFKSPSTLPSSPEVVEFQFQPESSELLLTSKSRLLNITNFKWIRNNELACYTNPSSINVIPVLVHTSRNHFLERETIRRTWGSLQNYRDYTIRPVFLIGEAGMSDMMMNLEEEQQLDQEHEQNGDVITGSFVDAYRNLTYKHMMGYKWILEYCPQAPLVLKTDDDIFLDVIRFIDTHIENSPTSTDHDPTTVDIYCYEFMSPKPIRDEINKWYVPPEEFPAPVYPNYCSGWAYGITVDWMRKMYAMSLMSRYFWVDDVFTGILLQMAKLAFREEPTLFNINGWYSVNNATNLEKMCSQNGTKEELRNATRAFTPVVDMPRDGNFRWGMECIWNKTLVDKQLM